MSEKMFFNGINAATGEYLLKPMEPEQLYSIITGTATDQALWKELKFKYEQSVTGHYGVIEGLDPKNLAESGWGVIFAADENPAVIEALKPLLDWRAAQAGDYFRVYKGGDGFRPGDTKQAWLSRNGAGPGPADPAVVPYYLMIVGDMERIPARFHTQLDVRYAVGRIFFETAEEYAFYAKSVVEAEKQQIRLPRKLAFFGTSHPDDPPTRLLTEQLILPLAQNLPQSRDTLPWEYVTFVKEQATKSRLGSLLGGPDTPALLFTGTHGVGFPCGDARQLAQQGGLLCQDWPGPGRTPGGISQDQYFCAEDLLPGASLWGLIAFIYASYGAATPRLDEITAREPKSQEPLAPSPFIARLPQKMLSHPKGGALAVVAQEDRSWGYSLPWEKTNRQQSVIESVLRQLMEGHPVGSAFEYLNQQYAELSTYLSDELEEISFGKASNPFELAGLWAANNDARNFTILGDPAVRLMVSESDAQVTGRMLQLETANTAGAPAHPMEGQPFVPDFLPMIRSKNVEDALAGAEKAVQVLKQSVAISERMVKEAKETELNEEDQKVLREAKLVRSEIAQIVLLVQNGKAQEREKALLLLEKFGPIARTEAVPVLKELILKDPDEQIRPRLVRTIVAVDNREDDLAEELRSFLKGGTAEVRLEVLEAFKGLKKPQKPFKAEIIKDLWDLLKEEGAGSKVLEKVVEVLYVTSDQKTSLLTQFLERIDQGELGYPAARSVVGELFLLEKKSLETSWLESRENRSLIFEVLSATLSEGKDQARIAVVAWLLERVGDIPGELLDKMIKDLKVLSVREEAWVETSRLQILLRNLVKRKREERVILKEELEAGDMATQVEAIKRAADSADEWALRTLIEEWSHWIATGLTEKAPLVEEVAEKIRTNEQAVLPLVNLMTQEYQLPKSEILQPVPAERPGLAAAVAEGEVPPEAPVNGGVRPVDQAKVPVELAKAPVELAKAPVELAKAPVELAKAPVELAKDKDGLQLLIGSELEELNARALNIDQRILKQMRTNPKLETMDDEFRRKLIRSFLAEETKACELRVHRRVARQLADMSNPYFFNDKDPEESQRYQSIKEAMTKYAVPVLARVLPEAEDDEIRKDLAFTLGNIGGRESVDALARAVVGEERTRANRQKLLAEYYLNPSKQRSEEAAMILKEAINDAKRTLWFQQGLNIAVFVVGLIILVAGLVIALGSQDNATRVAGVLAGIGGFGGVILQLINNPLDRIQNAMANLVQLETAFTSFIWELNLNGTYIQSQYVAEGILEGDDIGQTIQRIEDAMNLTLDQVAAYTDRGRQIPIPYISRLSPVVGKPGSAVQVFCRNLRRTSVKKEDDPHIAVAVNHIPVMSGSLGKKKDIAEFQLSPDLKPFSGAASGTVWISLVVDGQETNALPFQLLMD